MTKRFMIFMALVMAGLSLQLTACNDHDVSGLDGLYPCNPLGFEGLTPTDGDGNLTGSSDDGGWCYPGNGANDQQPFLYPARPNPFYPATTISFNLPAPAPVTFLIFNSDCDTVRTLYDNEFLPEGFHSIMWDIRDDQGRTVPEGMYSVSFQADAFTCHGNLNVHLLD